MDVMKFPTFFLLTLIPLLLVKNTIAGPPQRLIIQFDTSLSHEQKQTINEQIKPIIKSDYTLLPHSTDQRWIIVVDPALNEADLNETIDEMIKLEHVNYVEPDQLMEIFR